MFAANVAIEYASTAGPNYDKSHLDRTPGTLLLPFRYGRGDDQFCDDRGALPEANYTWKQTFGIFGDRFGMSVSEVVAIMGGHSLGRAQMKNSGFDGGWSAYQSSFSNNYFKNFNVSKWDNKNGSSVYVAGNTMSLQADVEIYFQSNQTSSNWNSTYCNTFESYEPTERCPLQMGGTSIAFLSYARSDFGMTYFYGNFSNAWRLMTEYLQDGKLKNVSEYT